MQIFDSLLGEWMFCPRAGGELHELGLTLDTITRAVSPHLARTKPAGSGADRDMFAFGETAGVYGCEEDGVVSWLDVQVNGAASKDARDRCARALLGLGVEGLVLCHEGLPPARQIDLVDEAAVRRFVRG